MSRLTRREEQILDLIAQGHPVADIARALDITAFTVRKHRSNIAAKTGSHTTTQLVSLAIRRQQRTPSTQEPGPATGGGCGTPEDLAAALSNAGRMPLLGAREMQVLRQLSQGLTHKQIGRTLDISPRTVSKHIENIRRKTAIGSLSG